MIFFKQSILTIEALSGVQIWIFFFFQIYLSFFSYLSTIQLEFTTTCNHLLQRVSQLSIDDLYNPDGITAMIGQPVAPLILGIYEHYEEHAHELEQLNR